ncbi:hypothetical protein J6590_090514, partial [Homalodisca vitripennis]
EAKDLKEKLDLRKVVTAKGEYRRFCAYFYDAKSIINRSRVTANERQSRTLCTSPRPTIEWVGDHFWLVYTFQLNPPLGTSKTDVSLKSEQPYGWHITNRKCRYYGVHGQFDRSSPSLLWEMTVGVGGVCSLTSEVLASLNKGVPPPAYFDWRGWFRSGPLLPGSMILRCSALILPHGSR